MMFTGSKATIKLLFLTNFYQKLLMLKTIIIEDEPLTAQAIEFTIEKYCNYLKVKKIAHSVSEGVDAIKNYDPDIILLDIQLPDGTGFDLLKKIEKHSFLVVFVTAFENYALQAIKFNAFDYILKPFKTKELINVLERAVKTIERNQQQANFKVLFDNISSSEKQQQKIVLRSENIVHIVKINDIIYCRADSSYTHFY